jgi:hypothetical protein
MTDDPNPGERPPRFVIALYVVVIVGALAYGLLVSC